MSDERIRELFERLKRGVINYDEEAVAESAKAVVAEGIDTSKAVFEGLVPGMEYVGELYERQEYFISELLLCADAMYVGLNILGPHLGKKDFGVTGVLLIGTVQGDVHDIGKNVVKMMFELAGFEIHDLGRDVPVEVFVEEQLRTNADLVCLSSLMTTTMVGMKDVILRIKEKNPKASIMIGGAPVTEEIAEKFGADGYAKDANNAIKVAMKLLSNLKNMRHEK